MTDDFNAACQRMRAHYETEEAIENSPYHGNFGNRFLNDAREILGGGIFDRSPITAESLAAMGVVRRDGTNEWTISGGLRLYEIYAGEWTVWAVDRSDATLAGTVTTCGQVRCLMLGLHDA